MKTKLIAAFLLILPFIVQGQKEDFVPPDFTPPSPTAFELGNYGYANVGMHTGTASTSIPLYNYMAGKIAVPISLSYSSNGIKVDQLSSNVGLGWSLNAGGVITRIVMGKSDEDNQLLWPQTDIDQWGPYSPTAMDFFYNIGNGANVDGEPDQFAYNFNGYTGKFAYTKEHELILMPHKDIKMEPYVDGSNSGFMATTPDGVKYIFLDQELNTNRSVSEGHIPPGPEAITAWYLSEIVHPNGDSVDFIYSNASYSYFVGISESVKVPSPPIQRISCTNWSSANDYEIDSVKSKLTVVSKKLTQIKSSNALDGKVDILHGFTHPENGSYDILSQIKVSDSVNTVLEKIDFQYLSTTNDRLFLSGLQFNDPEKKYEFDYINPSNLPIRLSYSQDHWGYYNGVSNTYKFPNPSLMDNYHIHNDFRKLNIGANREIDTLKSQTGLLKRVIYPTGGYTELSYESNSYYGEKKIYPSSTTSYLTLDTDENAITGGTDTETITNILSDQDVDFYASVGFNQYDTDCDYSSYPLHHIVATITVTNTTTSQTNTVYERTAAGDLARGSSFNITPEDFKSDYFFKFKANSNYLIELKLAKTCLTAAMNLTYFQGSVQTVDDNIKIGGNRVKTVSVYDPVSDKTETKRYYYAQMDNLVESTGEKGIMPFYESDAETQYPCGVGQGTVYYNSTYKLLNSSSTRPLSNPASGIVSYQYVTVSYGGDDFENGGEQHEFIMGYDYPGNYLVGEYIQSAPWTNQGWDNGLEKEQLVFKKNDQGTDFVVLKEIKNSYKLDTRILDTIKGYAVRKKYDLVFSGNVTYECTANDIDKTYTYTYCSASHSHVWHLSGLAGTFCIASGADMETSSIPHKCKAQNKIVGEYVTYPDQIRNLDVTEYESRSYWHYLDSTIVKQYDTDGLNPVTTSTAYFYDNEDHLQLTRTKMNDSRGNVVESTMYYPDDVLSVSDLPGGDISTSELKAIDTLRNHHRINTVLQRDQSDNSKVFMTRTLFKDWGQKSGSIEHIIEPKLIGSSKDSTAFIDRVEFLSYDAYGNPLEVKRTEGASTYYVWGYNNSKLIAKIENVGAINSTQQTAIDNAVSASNTDVNLATENTLRAELILLQSAFPDAMVTSYTYDPLIGVTSITDPKGQTTYYSYDEFGRLSLVKDNDQNVLSKNLYHYKTQ